MPNMTKKNQCINLSWKCETLTASYDLHFVDLLTENPTSYADGFRISMVPYIKGVTKIDLLEFDYEGIKYKMLPVTSHTIDDRGVAMAGFLLSNDATVECLNRYRRLDRTNISFLICVKPPIYRSQ